METNWKIIVPIAIVGLVLIAIAMSMRDTTPVAPVAPAIVEQSPVVSSPETPPTPSVSGNVDDMISILTSEASGDAAFAANVAESAAVVKSDAQEVNSLTTAYDETTF